MKVELDPLLTWVLREHGPEVREAIHQRVRRQQLLCVSDPAALIREALIDLHPRDFEFDPALEALPHGFCSD